MRLTSKVAFVSGGARGIGAAITTLFAEHGASVTFTDTLDQEGAQLQSELQKNGLNTLFLSMDVANEMEWNKAIDATVKHFGKLDILVNNAAIRDHSDIENTTVEDWDRVMTVNVKGVFLGTKIAIPAMRKSGGGSIINISSQFGIVGTALSGPAYQTSKGAVRIFSKTTAIRHGHEKIRVNSLHPGPIVTPFTEKLFTPGSPSVQGFLDKLPLGRIGTTKDIAYGALYLASDESDFVTGSELVIDGGWTAQ